MEFLEEPKGEFINYIEGNSQQDFRFSLIIPAYNEESRIRHFLEDIVNNLDFLDEIIVICDGSDSTAIVAREVSTNIKVLEYPGRLGKGGAILEGFRKATGDVIGYVDADGAIPWYDIEKVFTKVSSECPIVIGSRWMSKSKILRKQPLLRVILGRFYHYLTFALLGLPIKDTQCGIKAYKRNVINAIKKKVILRNLSIDTVILYHCKELGYTIREIPIDWRNMDGSRFNPMRSALLMLLSLVGIRISNSKFYGIFENFLSDAMDKANQR